MNQLMPDESELDVAWEALHKHSRAVPSALRHVEDLAGNELVDMVDTDMIAALDYNQACEVNRPM